MWSSRNYPENLTSYIITRLYTTWPALYQMRTSFSLKGFRFSMNFGPANRMTYRYPSTIITVGTGLCISGHSDVRGSGNNDFRIKFLFELQKSFNFNRSKIMYMGESSIKGIFIYSWASKFVLITPCEKPQAKYIEKVGITGKWSLYLTPIRKHLWLPENYNCKPIMPLKALICHK